MGVRFAIRGGNCNNSSNCGRYVYLYYTASTQTTGSVTLTFPAQSTDMLVQIMVAN